ncbi:MAG: ribonuclease Z [Bacteroidetes bacterium]|nr:MAG: ribonuclease Z [Bacteroidota bacterium]
MIKFSFTPLGISSALPAYGRHPSSFIVNHSEQIYLIDAGEGVQNQLRKYKFSIQKIKHIFISHLHGDHFFGILGLLTSMQLLGRQNELNIYAPVGMQEFVNVALKVSKTRFNFKIIYHELKPIDLPMEIHSDNRLKVTAVPLEHRTDCFGYIFEEHPRPRKLIKEKIAQYQIPIAWLSRIKAGEDYVTENNEIIPNTELTADPLPPRKFSFITDTLPLESIISYIRNSNLLYHEATFVSEKADRAKETYHSTAKDAAQIALKSNVKQLVLGHFSARYKDLTPFLNEAEAIFPNVALAEEGREFLIT